jgi:hypothetical protein
MTARAVASLILMLAACGARDPAPAAPAAGADPTASGDTIAASAEAGDTTWYCGLRCGESAAECERATEAQLPGDPPSRHRQLAAPPCRPAAVAYCFSYTYTLADTLALEDRARLGAVGQDRSPRQAQECYPTGEACDEAHDLRGRHGAMELTGCAPAQ